MGTSSRPAAAWTSLEPSEASPEPFPFHLCTAMGSKWQHEPAPDVSGGDTDSEPGNSSVRGGARDLRTSNRTYGPTYTSSNWPYVGYPSQKRGHEYLESQVAQTNGPLYPKVDHDWFKVAHNSEPLALQVLTRSHEPSCERLRRPAPGLWQHGLRERLRPCGALRPLQALQVQRGLAVRM